MAKSDKRSRKRGKLPKSIAGVKLPKQARKQAEKVIADLQQPIVREVIAGVIGIAATAIAKQAGAARSASKPNAGDSKSCGSEPFAEIATGLAMAGLGRFLEAVAALPGAAKKPEKGV